MLGNQSIKNHASLLLPEAEVCVQSPGDNLISSTSPLMLSNMKKIMNPTLGRMCDSLRSGRENESSHPNSRQSVCQSNPVE